MMRFMLVLSLLFFSSVGGCRPAAAPIASPAAQLAKEVTLDLGAKAVNMDSTVRFDSDGHVVGGVTPEKVTLKLVLIPAGKFLMGFPKTAVNSKSAIRHEVTISKPFYMGITEVTQVQYLAVTGKKPSKFEGAENPVRCVSWDDAVEFCKKLSAKTGKMIRLPTEAEWEYACHEGGRASDERPYGRSWSCGWWEGNSGGGPHPVAKKEPNSWGLYDMRGNMWEWCSDWYGEYPKGEAKNPTGPEKGADRVMRGGAYDSAFAYDLNSMHRSWNKPDSRHAANGFRVVMVVD